MKRPTQVLPISGLWFPPQRAALLVLAVSAVTILTALGFEHIGGYRPCPLCLQQRYAYYAALPLAGLAAIFYATARPVLATALLVLTALFFFINSGLGLYHSGIEWGWWKGPASCSGAGGLMRDASDLFARLDMLKTVPCNKAPWRFLGLSFAGYNALISLALAGLALAGARRLAVPEKALTAPSS